MNSREWKIDLDPEGLSKFREAQAENRQPFGITLGQQAEWMPRESGGSVMRVVFRDREEVGKYVGYPLFRACQMLFDRNIRTLDSVWTKSSVLNLGFAVITIDYNNLSEKNKIVVKSLESSGEVSVYPVGQMVICEAKIKVKPELQGQDPEKIAADIDRRATEFASKFEQQ